VDCDKQAEATVEAALQRLQPRLGQVSIQKWQMNFPEQRSSFSSASRAAWQ
jgi:hypothetical protein